MKTLLAALAFGFLIPAQPSNAQNPPVAPSIRQESVPATGPVRLAPASDFALDSLNGNIVHLSDFRGNVVLVNFWATWCGPCKILTPWLVELRNQYHPQGLEILGIALDEDATEVEIGEFSDKMKINFPILIGNENVARAYGGIPAMPATFLISRDGKIVETIVGLKSKGELEGSIKKAIDVQPAATQPTEGSTAQK